MGMILQSGATVLCAHAGQASATAPDPRVKVGGQPVTTQTAPWTIAGCTFAPGGVPTPCVTAQWTTAATRVRAGGAPVLLDSGQAVCAPNGTGVTVVVAQARVKAQ